MQVGTSGPRDAVRIKADALPTRGTRGVVLFPRGDVRNGIWLCAFGATLNDASPFVAANPNDDYEALWSGTWRLDAEDGTHVTVLPDGSTLVIGPAAPAVPVPVRHVVDTSQSPPRIAVPFSQAERVPTAPAPFPFSYSRTDGLSIAADAAGNLTVNVPDGANVNLTQGGLTAEDFVALVSKLVAAFNAHVHSGVMAGGSDTAVPVSQWTDSTIASVFARISS